MITETSDKSELFIEIDATVAALDELVSSLDEDKMNRIPYEGSWTAGELIRHITKSTNGMSEAMGTASKPAERNPSERVHALKKIFLDFTHKMKSPDFIVPEKQHYERPTAVEDLNASFKKLREHADRANLDDLIEGLPLGPITKLEILHFVLYHTQRHLHQMKRICDALV